MVKLSYEAHFKRAYKKLNRDMKTKVHKQIAKIIEGPEIGKPMKYSRKGTREIYISSYRLAYSYLEKKNEIVILDFYHKDGQ